MKKNKNKVQSSLLTLKSFYVKANLSKRRIKLPDLVLDKLNNLYDVPDENLTSAIKQKSNKPESSRILHVKSYIINNTLMIPLDNINILDLISCGNQHKLLEETNNVSDSNSTTENNIEELYEQVADVIVDEKLDPGFDYASERAELTKKISESNISYLNEISSSSFGQEIDLLGFKSKHSSKPKELSREKSTNMFILKNKVYLKVTVGSRTSFYNIATGKTLRSEYPDLSLDEFNQLELTPLYLYTNNLE